ncbi:MAG: hypothetical protein O2890_06435 [Cyanobacteria bacterium]|nr:hypothetical protein [Cyanobacteriota bacterium]
MSRYLLGGLLVFATIATLFGVGSSEGLMSRIDRGARASRNAISANPASASNASTIEQAGQNVQRQVTPEGVPATVNTTPATPNQTTTETTPTPAATGTADTTGNGTGASQPVQDPIPALW